MYNGPTYKLQSSLLHSATNPEHEENGVHVQWSYLQAEHEENEVHVQWSYLQATVLSSSFPASYRTLFGRNLLWLLKSIALIC